jgi:hypothetical protein
MFAAAFTVPGGNNQNKGTPIFLGKQVFSFFIILDAISLVTSSSAVLIFTGILTSRYSEEDFRPALLFNLLSGVYVIYISVLSMMFAFVAALILMGSYLVSVTAAASALIPVLVVTVMANRTVNVLFYYFHKTLKAITYYSH